MNHFLRWLFFCVLMRLLITVLFGVNIKYRKRLPRKGPRMIVANHNSHLDTIVLMSTFDWESLRKVRPVAAADYWVDGKSSFMRWFSMEIIGVIPIQRSRTPEEREQDRINNRDPLDEVNRWLQSGGIVLWFPEGTRAVTPEKMGNLKAGISFVLQSNPSVEVTPVLLHGLGKILPKGEFIPVPYFIDAIVGEPLSWTGNKDTFMAALVATLNGLQVESGFPAWE